jgi:UDP-2,3-diacylglucosamine hydrolase
MNKTSSSPPEYFISDAHFGAHPPDVEQRKIERFVSFLAHPDRQGATVWFLGDLFDFWLEYRHAIPKASIQVLHAIQKFVHDGGEFHLLLGNHDYWVNSFFTKELGVKLYREDVTIERDGKRILLSHGDGKAESDRGYRFLKKILRFRPGIWLYRHLPVDWAFSLARKSSHTSRAHTSNRSQVFANDYREFARKQITAGYHAVLMGHLHAAFCEELDGGWYINCGEWFDKFSYVTRIGEDFELHYWTE